MAKKTGEYPIPFDKDGNQFDYYEEHWMKDRTYLRDNYEFDAALSYVGYARGQSSATILFRDEEGHRYSMFLSELDSVFESGGFNGKQVTGRWTFVKRGQNYSIRLVTQ